MTAYRKILVFADAAMRDSPALQRAKQLAWMQGAELELCIVGYSAAIQAVGAVSLEVMELARRAFVDERSQWLKQQAESLQSSGLRVHTEVIWGHPVYEQAVAKIIAVQPDLVIKDAARDSSLKQVFASSLDTQLLRLCPVPLLLVRDGAVELPKRIAVAVDIRHPVSDIEGFNERLVRVARELSDNYKARLDVVHAFEGFPEFAALTGYGQAYGYADAYGKLLALHREDFYTFAERQGFSKEHAYFLSGLPSRAISQFTSEADIDMLVVGAQHHNALDRFMIGSTSESLLNHVGCDVLVVKPGDFAKRLGAIAVQAQAPLTEPATA